MLFIKTLLTSTANVQENLGSSNCNGCKKLEESAVALSDIMQLDGIIMPQPMQLPSLLQF